MGMTSSPMSTVLRVEIGARQSDFDKETIETNDEPSVNAHVLQSAGILSKERAMEISKSVLIEREEQW